jgi:serine/threonine protein phosphatase 1
MNLTYVIPDIHGRNDLLHEALAGIAAHAHGRAGVIVTIGDYVDKGPDSKGVIDRLMSGIDDGWTLVALKGNHDAMMVEAFRDPAKMAPWMGKGGDATLASYGGGPATVPTTHLAWLDQRHLLHVDAHRVYVHAGVDPEIPLGRQSEETLLWKRYPKGDPSGFGKLHVVHGHDNSADGPLLYAGRSNLDTLAWRTGRLTVGVFADDRPGGPVDFIVVKGPPAER